MIITTPSAVDNRQITQYLAVIAGETATGTNRNHPLAVTISKRRRFSVASGHRADYNRNDHSLSVYIKEHLNR